MGWNLSPPERSELRRQWQSSNDARVVRRSDALLKLDRGEPVSDVAGELGVSRQTLYNWKDWHEAHGRGLSDASRSGRPSCWRPRYVRRLRQSMNESPRDHGFHAGSWTSGLLQTHLRDVFDFEVSRRSIRRKLHDLGFVWKRFRYILEPDPKRDKKKTYPQSYPQVA
jgi:transposase